MESIIAVIQFSNPPIIKMSIFILLDNTKWNNHYKDPLFHNSRKSLTLLNHLHSSNNYYFDLELKSSSFINLLTPVGDMIFASSCIYSSVARSWAGYHLLSEWATVQTWHKCHLSRHKPANEKTS